MPFATLLPTTREFVLQLFVYLLLSSQTLSPALLSYPVRREKAPLERVFGGPAAMTVRGLVPWFEEEEDALRRGGRVVVLRQGEKEVLGWAVTVALRELTGAVAAL